MKEKKESDPKQPPTRERRTAPGRHAPTIYKDTGCSKNHPSCLNCTLPECKHDLENHHDKKTEDDSCYSQQQSQN